jgi:hypothetical protein
MLLTELAFKLQAKLSKDRPGYPEGMITFEERRIEWQDNEINKAIIIQPTFEVNGLNSDLWNLINIAWYDVPNTAIRLRWIKKLIEKSTFQNIEKDIDNLLILSEIQLANIKQEDLK